MIENININKVVEECKYVVKKNRRMSLLLPTYNLHNWYSLHNFEAYKRPVKIFFYIFFFYI